MAQDPGDRIQALERDCRILHIRDSDLASFIRMCFE